MHWEPGKLAPSDELEQAVAEVLPLAQKLGMDINDVRSMFKGFAEAGYQDISFMVRVCKTTLEGIKSDEDELLRQANDQAQTGERPGKGNTTPL